MLYFIFFKNLPVLVSIQMSQKNKYMDAKILTRSSVCGIVSSKAVRDESNRLIGGHKVNEGVSHRKSEHQ